MKGLKGRAIQPQAAYIHQPGGRVFNCYVHHEFGPKMLIIFGAVATHYVKSLEDDGCPLRRLEVLSKWLWKEGRKI